LAKILLTGDAIAMKKGLLAAGCFGLLLGLGIPMTAFEGEAEKGKAVFDNCGICHNADSTEAKVGPGLKGLFKKEKLVNGKPVTDENVKALIIEGTGAMPGFGDSISKEDQDNLIAYLKTL
jgi:cytochrome c